MLKLKGKIVEIGDLEDGSGRGIRLNCAGNYLAVIGLTEDECRAAAQRFGGEVEITIVSAGDSTNQPAP